MFGICKKWLLVAFPRTSLLLAPSSSLVNPAFQSASSTSTEDSSFSTSTTTTSTEVVLEETSDTNIESFLEESHQDNLSTGTTPDLQLRDEVHDKSKIIVVANNETEDSSRVSGFGSFVRRLTYLHSEAKAIDDETRYSLQKQVWDSLDASEQERILGSDAENQMMMIDLSAKKDLHRFCKKSDLDPALFLSSLRTKGGDFPGQAETKGNQKVDGQQNRPDGNSLEPEEDRELDLLSAITEEAISSVFNDLVKDQEAAAKWTKLCVKEAAREQKNLEQMTDFAVEQALLAMEEEQLNKLTAKAMMKVRASDVTVRESRNKKRQGNKTATKIISSSRKATISTKTFVSARLSSSSSAVTTACYPLNHEFHTQKESHLLPFLIFREAFRRSINVEKLNKELTKGTNLETIENLEEKIFEIFVSRKDKDKLLKESNSKTTKM